MPEETTTIAPGFKFPVIYEVTRPVENGEKVPAPDGTMNEISNLRGYLFWAKPVGGGKELIACLDLTQRKGWFKINDALVKLIESVPPYA